MIIYFGFSKSDCLTSKKSCTNSQSEMFGGSLISACSTILKECGGEDTIYNK